MRYEVKVWLGHFPMEWEVYEWEGTVKSLVERVEADTQALFGEIPCEIEVRP